MSIAGINIPNLNKVVNNITTNGVTGIGAPSFPFASGGIILTGQGNIFTSVGVTSSSGSAIIISGSGIPLNTVLIQTLSDLPTPVSNRITLEDNKIYKFASIVNLSNNGLVLGVNNVLLGSSPMNDGIISSYSGPVISGINTSFGFRNLKLSTTNGIAFHVLNSNVGIANIKNSIFSGCSGVGNLSGILSLAIEENSFIFNGNGVNIYGSGTFLGVNNNKFYSNSGFCTGISLISGSGIYGASDIVDNMFDMASGQVCLFANSGFSRTGTLDSNIFGGTGVQISGGLNKTDVDWLFINNFQVADSRFYGSITLTGNSTATLNPTAGVMQRVSGFSLTGNIMERFAMSNSGEMKYIGKQNFDGTAIISATIRTNAGTNKIIAVNFFKNGIALGNVNRESNSNTTNSAIGFQSYINLISGDTLAFALTNRTDTNSIIVQDYNFAIFK